MKETTTTTSASDATGMTQCNARKIASETLGAAAFAKEIAPVVSWIADSLIDEFLQNHSRKPTKDQLADTTARFENDFDGTLSPLVPVGAASAIRVRCTINSSPSTASGTSSCTAPRSTSSRRTPARAGSRVVEEGLYGPTGGWMANIAANSCATYGLSATGARKLDATCLA